MVRKFRHFIKDDRIMSNNQMKRSVSKEFPIKTTIRCHYTPMKAYVHPKTCT